MKRAKTILGLLCLAFLLWAIVGWPLPRYAGSAIPTSAHNESREAPRRMIAGDQLQFLYHMWLAKDTFSGPTQLFHNPYEFNTGNEAERYFPSMRYYLPFSLIFTLTSFGGQAFAWNAMGFVTLWITLVFTWLLARRYTESRAVALLAATVSMVFPYRWITLLGGSPTGLAMMWVPITFYGLDVMIRDRKIWGSILAGSAIFLAGWCDPHVVFFTGVAAPFWCILCWLFHRKKLLPGRQDLTSLFRAGLPLLIFVVMVVVQARGTKVSLEDTPLDGSKDGEHPMQTVANNSPYLKGVISRQPRGIDNQIYMGGLIIVLLAGAVGATCSRRCRTQASPTGRPGLSLVLLCLALVATTLLAAGTNMPGGTRAWRLLTRVLPPYGMIRQPAKIFILAPSLFAIALAMGLPALLSIIGLAKRHRLACLVLGAALLADYATFVHPSLCLLNREQGAYRAIADHADKQGRNPHILAIPLWPGDSHWTSLNQYYISLYHIRMINGYRPTLRLTYLEDVYNPLESCNKGGYSRAQLDSLLGRGVEYIVLHENAFPEKVSPFAVSHVLRSLLAHPDIKFLAQDGPVWAFTIVNDGSGVYPNLPSWAYHFPARLWQAERSVWENATVLDEADTSGKRFLRLANTNAVVTTQTYPTTSLSNLCYLVRTRSQEKIQATVLRNGNPLPPVELPPTAGTWTWHQVPIPSFAGYDTFQLQLRPGAAPGDVDLAILATTDWQPAAMVSPLTIPAPVFFHAGHTDLEKDEVVFLPDRDPTGDAVLYGPKLPVPPGRYAIELQFSSDAKPGTLLGELGPRYPHGQMAITPVIAGQPVKATYSQSNNLRMAIDFRYSRRAPIRIQSLTITPLETR